MKSADYELNGWVLKTAYITHVSAKKKVKERKKSTKSGKRRNRTKNYTYTFQVKDNE